MRKHSVRKWLHAILDLLPVIILPIFAIYSHRHTIESYEVTVPQNEVVNFNQLMPNDKIEFEISSTGSVYLDYTTLELTGNHKYLFNFVPSAYNSGGTLQFQFYLYNFVPSSTTIYRFNSGVYTWDNDERCTLGYTNYLVEDTYYNYNGYINYFDLTVMFGSGNEPTYEQFISWYPNDYYEYNTGTKQLLKNVSTVTYDNSDIGSQMIYSLYKPINDYFNLNNVFNFGAIYEWFELNMFNGNAPLSIFIVWNIIVYEFIMDIIFLIYSVFMFVIDFATNTLDRFTGWAKRGD